MLKHALFLYLALNCSIMIPTGPHAELTQGLRSSSTHTILIDQKDVTQNDDDDNNEPSEDVSCTANRVYLPFTDIIWNVFCLDRGILAGILTYKSGNKPLKNKDSMQANIAKLLPTKKPFKNEASC